MVIMYFFESLVMVFRIKCVKFSLFLMALFICMQSGCFVNAHDTDIISHLEKIDVDGVDVKKYADMEKNKATAYRIILEIYADLNESDLSNLQFCQHMTEKLNAYPRPKDIVRTKVIFSEFFEQNQLIKHPIKDNPNSPFYEGKKKKRRKMIYPIKEYEGKGKRSSVPIISFKTEQDQRDHLERQRVVSDQLIARDQLLGKSRAKTRSRDVRTKSSSTIGVYRQYLKPERLTSEPILAPDQSSSTFSGHLHQKTSSLENFDSSFQESSLESVGAIKPSHKVRLPTRTEFKKSVRAKKLERQKAERVPLDSGNIQGDDSY